MIDVAPVAFDKCGKDYGFTDRAGNLKLIQLAAMGNKNVFKLLKTICKGLLMFSFSGLKKVFVFPPR